MGKSILLLVSEGLTHSRCIWVRNLRGGLLYVPSQPDSKDRDFFGIIGFSSFLQKHHRKYLQLLGCPGHKRTAEVTQNQVGFIVCQLCPWKSPPSAEMNNSIAAGLQISPFAHFQCYQSL